MQFNALVALFALLVVVDANERHARLAKRQILTTTTTTTSSAASTFTSTTSSTTASTTSATTTSPNTSLAGTTIPPLTQITSGMPSQSTLPVTATYPAGATPPISGAPPLPSPFVFIAKDWPHQDQIAPTTDPEVDEWMTELDGSNIPDIPQTADGTCIGDPVAASEASTRGWWTCGGHTRSTDITVCPDKLTWGVSFDDGPAPHSQSLLSHCSRHVLTPLSFDNSAQELLEFLDSKNLKSTFFVVGSRVVERSQVLVEEYMKGHEIAVHTWSHKPLTTLSNRQIVAELGYTRKAIKRVIGVTPTLMRPPYGDIDDRVRAISLAMGLIPTIWTRTPSGFSFDTSDWEIPAGKVNGSQSLAIFQSILDNATILDTGLVVLQHDLFVQTVDLAIGYTLPMALSYKPALTFDTIGSCNGIPATNLYAESNKNSTFPYHNSTLSANNTTNSTGNSHTSGTALNAAIPLSAALVSLLVLVISL